jgi:hypothetical protein
MRLLQALRPSEFAAPVDGSLTALGRFKAQIIGLLRGRKYASDQLESPIEGQTWTDSLEREFNSEAAIYRRLRF